MGRCGDVGLGLLFFDLMFLRIFFGDGYKGRFGGFFFKNFYI